jgi:hypothetical protein
MQRAMKAFLLLCALAVSAGGRLPGQATSARIYGNVQSEEGEFLAGVEVTAVNVANNAETKVFTSGGKGAFSFLGLAPGIYQVSFDMAGYQSHVASGIQLSADQSATLRIKLQRLPDGEGLVSGSDAEAPPPDAEPWKKWQVELGAGAFFAEPRELNRVIDRDRQFLRSLAYHYMSSPYPFQVVTHIGVGSGVLLPLGGIQPLVARLRHFVSPMISLAAGISISDRRQASASTITYRFVNSGWQTNPYPERFSVVGEVPDYRLGMKMIYPHLGAQASLALNPSVRLGAYAHAGWIFAECRYDATMIFRDGVLGQVQTHELAMTGRGNSAAFETGARLEIDAWKGLGVFIEGGYLLGRVKSWDGESSSAVTVRDANTQEVLSSGGEHLKGRWLLAPDMYAAPFIPNPGDESWASPFRLDLGGGGFRAGLFCRF